jgi:hypothetical protein
MLGTPKERRLIAAGGLLNKLRDKSSAFVAELRLWGAGRTDSNKRARILFFPSGDRKGSSLLRAYNIVEALRPFGWVAGAVPGTVNRRGRGRIIRRFRPDLLVFQQCRHPLNDGDVAFGIPYVVDTDDADFHLEIPGLAERLERTVRGARGVIAGGAYIRDHHKRLNSNVTVIWTGTPISKDPWPRHLEREAKGPPVVAWAQARPLDYPRELEFIVKVDARMRSAGSRHRLRLYGIDNEADQQELTHRFSSDALIEFLPTLGYQEFLASLRDVSVGLCPLILDSPFSRGKSFGKILGYLDAGVPVIASDAADHARFFDADSGVISDDIDTWVQAALALLADPAQRDRMAERAHAALHQRLSVEAAAARTDTFLRKLLGIAPQDEKWIRY